MVSIPKQWIVLGGTSSVMGGVERYCERLCQALRGVEGAAVEHIWAESGSMRHRGWRGVMRFLVAMVSGMARMHRIARSSRDVVVLVQYGGFLDCAWPLLMRLAGCRQVVVTVHAGPAWAAFRYAITRKIISLSMAPAAVVVALSDEHRDYLARLIPKKLTVLPTLISNAVLDAANAIRRPRKSNVRRILFIGRPVASKGYSEFLAAAKSLVVRGHLVSAVAIGGDSCGSMRLHDGSAARMTSLGRVSESRVASVLSRAAVLVMTSRAEALPLAVIEARAMGVAVVAYDIPVVGGSLKRYGVTLVQMGDPDALVASVDSALRGSSADLPPAILSALQWPQVVESYCNAIKGQGIAI